MIQFNVKTGEIETVLVPWESAAFIVNIKPKSEDFRLPDDFAEEAVKKLDEIFPEA